MRPPRRELFAAAALVASAAFAWDYEVQWYDPAAASATPSTRVGGGGLIGDGSFHSGKINCTSCHTPPKSMIGATFNFSPSLLAAPDGGSRYAPNTPYQVTVAMTGEHVLNPDGGLSQNGFAGELEFPDGGTAGTLDSDTPGITHSPCPQRAALATLPDAGTTVVYNDCRAVLHRSKPGLTQWQFTWTAPPSGQPTVTFFYGVVDGTGAEHSRLSDGGYSDDVKYGTYVLEP